MTRNDFRFNSKSAFLTYPQCGSLSKERVLEFLRDTLSADWYSVGLEQHEDGGNHIHAYAEWNTRRNIRTSSYFDVDGQHPNIQSARCKTNVLRYVQKGGDYIGNLEKGRGGGIAYGEIIQECDNSKDFLARVIQDDPRRAVYGLQHLQYFADYHYGRVDEDYVPEFTFDREKLPDGMKEWLDTEFVKVKWFRGAPVPSFPSFINIPSHAYIGRIA